MVNDDGLPPETPAEYYARRGQVVVETLVVLGAVVAFEHFVLGRAVGSFKSHPHPYWLIVLPLAAGRGMVAGLFAAALSSLLYAYGASVALDVDSLRALLDRDVLSEPCLFLAAGFVVGELRDHVIDRHYELVGRVASTELLAARHRRERDALRVSTEVLSRRMVDASVQFAEAAEIAERLESSSEQEALELALALVDEHCGAWASIVVPNKHGLDIAAFRGWHPDERGARLAAAQRSSVVERALRSGLPVNGLAPDEEAPSEGPLMAFPILGAEGVVRAVLAVDHVPLHLLDATTYDTIVAVSRWVAGALVRSSERGRPVETIETAPVAVGTPDEFALRLALEGERALRYGVPCSLVLIQARGLGAQDARGRRRMDGEIVARISGNIRLGDALYELGLPGCYVLVAANTDLDGVNVLAGRLEAQLRPDPRQPAPDAYIDTYGADEVGQDIHGLLDTIFALAAERSDVAVSSARSIDVPTEIPPGDADDFWARLNTEASLAMRRGDTFHVVQVTAEHPDRDDGHLLRRLSQVTQSRLRPIDTPYLLGPGHAAVVLPYTEKDAAEEVARRLVESLRAMDAAPPFGELTASVMAGLQDGQEHGAGAPQGSQGAAR